MFQQFSITVRQYSKAAHRMQIKSPQPMSRNTKRHMNLKMEKLYMLDEQMIYKFIINKFVEEKETVTHSNLGMNFFDVALLEA